MHSDDIVTYEWWPDFVAGPLFRRTGRGGEKADLSSLSLSAQLEEALRIWNEEYEEDKLPIDGPGDRDRVLRGIQLLGETRKELTGRASLIVTEPWWDVGPADE
jgi:hypothetical protein